MIGRRHIEPFRSVSAQSLERIYFSAAPVHPIRGGNVERLSACPLPK
jgi:hypothetical protein